MVAINSPSLRTVALRSGQSLLAVVGVVAAEAEGWDDDDTAAALGMEPEAVTAIREALAEKGLAGETLETVTVSGAPKTVSSGAERARRCREKKAAAKNGGNASNADVTPRNDDVTPEMLQAVTCNADVTPCNASNADVTPRNVSPPSPPCSPPLSPDPSHPPYNPPQPHAPLLERERDFQQEPWTEKPPAQAAKPSATPQSPEQTATAKAIIAALDTAVSAAWPGVRRMPHAQDLPVARSMAQAGADAALCAEVFAAICQRKADQGEHAPAGLSYFRQPISDAIAAQQSPMPRPQTGGHSHAARHPQSSRPAAYRTGGTDDDILRACGLLPGKDPGVDPRRAAAHWPDGGDCLDGDYRPV